MKIYIVSITEEVGGVNSPADIRTFKTKAKAGAFMLEMFKAFLTDYTITAQTVISKDETDFLIEEKGYRIRGKLLEQCPEE